MSAPIAAMRLEDLLAPESPDPSGEALLKAPLYLSKAEARKGDIEYKAIVSAPLKKRELMDLLLGIAPYKAHGPDDFKGVIDDWQIFERAASGGASSNLLQEHARGLKGSWREFSRHYRHFLEIFEDRTDTAFVIPMLRWRKDLAGVRRWCFDFLDAEDGAALKSLREYELEERTLNPLVGMLTVPYFRPQLRKRWPEWRPLVKDGKSNIMGPAQAPVLTLLH